MAPRLPWRPGATRLPSYDGDGGITPPRLLDGEPEAEDDGVDMPPPPLPDPDNFPVLLPRPGWGTWHLEPVDDGEQDHGHGHGHGHHAADDDPLGFNTFTTELVGFPGPEPTDPAVGTQPADAPVVVAEDGENEAPVMVIEQLESGDGEEDEKVYIPHYDFDLLIQPDEEDFNPEMPPLMDDNEDFDDRPMARRGPIVIRSLADIRCIRSNPLKYAQSCDYTILSFRFGDTLELLHGIRMASHDMGWDRIGNLKRLIQAARLAGTFAQLSDRLSCLSRSFQEHCLDKDKTQSLHALLPELVANRTSLQPPIIKYYADAITAAIKFISARVAAAPCLTDYEDLNSSVHYMLERIGALDKEEVHYPDDILPQQLMLSLFEDYEEDGEEPEDGEEEEVEEEEEDYMFDLRFMFQAEDENDPETPKRVSDCDNTDSQYDDALEQFVVIRGLSGLEHIKSAPHRYSRSSYYIIQSFCFGEVWDLLHGIREVSASQGWLWVGNFELLKQVHSLRDCFVLLHRELNRLLRDHHFDRESVSSLEHFTPDLDFSRTSMQPPNVHYWVDSIAVSLQSLIAKLWHELSAESHARRRDFTDIDAHVRAILQRMDAMDNEHVQYSQHVFPPEVLPALPGYPPIPLPSPDTSQLPSPENSPKCADTATNSP